MGTRKSPTKHKSTRIFSNADIIRLVAGIPRNHHHIRMSIETVDHERIVFQEATLAAISRAYLSILLHPEKRVTQLLLEEIQGKLGYASPQLQESDMNEDQLLDEFTDIVLN